MMERSSLVLKSAFALLCLLTSSGWRNQRVSQPGTCPPACCRQEVFPKGGESRLTSDSAPRLEH